MLRTAPPVLSILCGFHLALPQPLLLGRGPWNRQPGQLGLGKWLISDCRKQHEPQEKAGVCLGGVAKLLGAAPGPFSRFKAKMSH